MPQLVQNARWVLPPSNLSVFYFKSIYLVYFDFGLIHSVDGGSHVCQCGR